MALLINNIFEIIKYLHENGYPWGKEACMAVTENNQLDIYLHENGCPCNKWVYHTIE